MDGWITALTSGNVRFGFKAERSLTRLASNFGEFPSDRSRQPTDQVWGETGVLSPYEFESLPAGGMAHRTG